MLMIRMKEILFISLLLVLCCVPALGCWGKTAPNYGDMTPDYDLLTGSELVLNCSLKSHQVMLKDMETYTVNSSLIVFKKLLGSLSGIVYIVDDLTAQLRIPRATVSDSGMYLCHLALPPGEHLVCGSKVSVGSAPQPVKNFRCVYKYYENLTCSWDIENNIVQTKYQLTKHHFFSDSFEKPLLQNCPTETSNSTYCQWRLDTDPPFDVKEEKFTFVLYGNNSLGVSNETFTYKLAEILLPRAPRNLSAVKTDKQKMTLRWFPPKGTNNTQHPPPLEYELWIEEMTRESGHKVIVNISYDTTEYTITNLIPFVMYRISLRCRSKYAIGNDMWSPFTVIQKRTLPDVPYHAPEIADEAYEMHHFGGFRYVTLYWKPVPEKYHNGENFMYHIVYFQNTSRSEQLIATANTVNVTSLTVTIQYLLEDVPYVFRIHSFNKEGLSPSYSTILLNKQSKIPPLPHDVTAISHDPGHYELSWKEPSNPNFQTVDYVVFWCSSLKPWLSRCEEPIQWLPEPITENKVTLNLSDSTTNFQFAVAARTGEASSGLQWASCIVPFKGALGKISYVVVEAETATSLKVIWKLDCTAQKAVVKKFEIVYCRLNNKNECSGKHESVEVIKPDAESFVLQNLHPFSNYSVIIRAYNLAGVASEDSDPKFQSTRQGAPTDPPQKIEVFATPNASLRVSWQPPSQPNGVVTHYQLMYNSEIKEIKSDPKQSFYAQDISGLTHYANYSIRLKACVNHYCSPASKAIFVRTDIGIPGEMDPPRVESVNSTFVKVSWNRPQQPNGPVSFYEVSWLLETKDNNSDLTDAKSKLVQNAYSSLVELDCENYEEEGIKYLFFVRAANIKNDEFLYGPPSDVTQTRGCLMPPRLAMIIGVAVGGTFALAVVMFLVYKLIKWMSEKIHQVKSIKIRLPKGLDGPETNPLNNYENFKNGLSPQTPTNKGMGRLSYIIDDSDNKNRHGSGSSQYSSSSTDELLYRNGKCTKFGRKPSGDSSGCSSMSFNTNKMHHSSDSGAESDFMTPPSPDIIQSSHSVHKSALPIVLEAQDSLPIANTPKVEDTLIDSSKQLENSSSLSNGIVLKIDQPYSKFGISGNSGSVPPWWMNPLAFYSCNLSNSEPSVLDLDPSTKIYMPYSKIGLAKSSTNLLTLPALSQEVGYSKFGIMPNRDRVKFHPSYVNGSNGHCVIPGIKSPLINKSALPSSNFHDINPDQIIEILNNRYKNGNSKNFESEMINNKLLTRMPDELVYVSDKNYHPKNGYSEDSGYIKVGIPPHNRGCISSGYVPLNKISSMNQAEPVQRSSSDVIVINSEVKKPPTLNSEIYNNFHNRPTEYSTEDVKNVNVPITCNGFEPESAPAYQVDEQQMSLPGNEMCSDSLQQLDSKSCLNVPFNNSTPFSEVPNIDFGQVVDYGDTALHLNAGTCIVPEETYLSSSPLQHSLLANGSNVSDSDSIHSDTDNKLANADCGNVVLDEPIKCYESNALTTPADNTFQTVNNPDSDSKEKTLNSGLKKNGYVQFSALMKGRDETVGNVPNIQGTAQNKISSDTVNSLLPCTSTLKDLPVNTTDTKVPHLFDNNRTSVAEADLPSSYNIPQYYMNGFGGTNCYPKNIVPRLKGGSSEAPVDYLVNFSPRVESEICEV